MYKKLKENYLYYLKIIIGWPLSIIAFLFIVKLIWPKSGSILSYIRQINITFIIISLVCFQIYFLLRASVWKRILDDRGYNIPFKKIVFFWGFSEFKRYIPGNIWSFIARTVSFKEIGVKAKDVIYSLITEIQLVIISGFIISLFYLSSILDFSSSPYYKVYVLYLAFVVFPIYLFIFVFGSRLKNNKGRFLSFLYKIIPQSSYYENFINILIYCLAMIFFGLGTYFTIISLFYLNPGQISEFVGLFVFSLFIGYISIIAPMGLGVRETVLTLGLSKVLTIYQAGFVSIFARVWFIFSEVFFLSLVFIWNKTKNRVILKIEGYISNHKQEALLFVFILAYFLYFTTASFLRYDNFYTGRFDLGNMDQTVWNTAHGKFFQLTDPNGTDSISRLAFHADFILALISPFYFIWSSPKFLLLLQSIILSLDSIFLFLIAKDKLKNKNLALAISLSYLLYPAMEYSNLYDFHPIVLATTFFIAAFYFLLKNKPLFFILFLILAALTKEEAWFVGGLLALYGFFINFNRKINKRKKTIILALMFSIFLISTLVFFYLISTAIPHALGGKQFALSYYSEFGDSPSSVIKNTLFHPQKTFFAIAQPSQLNFIFQLLFPLGFLPIFAPFYIIFAVPDLLIDLLSSNSQLHRIYYQYTAPITPFLFISLIYAIKNIKSFFKRIPNRIYIIFVIFFSLLSAFIMGPLPGSFRPSIDMFAKQSDDNKLIESFLSTINNDYTIAATNNLGSHLSHREHIYTIPVGIDKADIVLFLLNDKFAKPSPIEQRQFANKMREDKHYVEVFKKGNFIVFEKRSLYLKRKPDKKDILLFPYSVPTLEDRDYSPSNITIDKKVSSNNFFTTYIISYYSDGLKLYALMNVPRSTAPNGGFPILILNHGFINPLKYNTLTSYKQITDSFSKEGFIVIKPDYRGNDQSEVTIRNSVTRFAWPVDIINLIESLPSIKDANADKVYLWGHAQGGEAVLKVLEIAGSGGEEDLQSKIKKAVVWAPTIDPVRLYDKSLPVSKNSGIIKILGEPDKNPQLWQSLSPLPYLQTINTPILINQSVEDPVIPYQWSVELYDDFLSLNKDAKLYLYSQSDQSSTLPWDGTIKESLNFLKSN